MFDLVAYRYWRRKTFYVLQGNVSTPLASPKIDLGSILMLRVLERLLIKQSIMAIVKGYIFAPVFL